MYSENGKYPDCKQIKRVVEVGGLTKTQLLYKLQQHSIMMNELGEILINDKKDHCRNANDPFCIYL